MFAWDFYWFAEADFVHSSDATLVLSFVNEILNDIVSLLQVPGDIAAYPICSICPLALHQISNDGASTIVGRGRPNKANGAVGGICHTWVHNRTRRSWERENWSSSSNTSNLIMFNKISMAIV